MIQVSLLNRIIPFLSTLINSGVATNALSKLDPRLRGFISGAASMGYTTDQIIQYLRSRITPEGQKASHAKLSQKVESGRAQPYEAASLQRMNQAQVDMPAKLAGGLAGLAGGLLGANLANDVVEPEVLARENRSSPDTWSVINPAPSEIAGSERRALPNLQQPPAREPSPSPEPEPPQPSPSPQLDMMKIIQDHPLASTIDKFLRAGESHRTIAEYLRSSYQEDAQDLEDSLGMGLEEAIKLYAKKRKGKRTLRENLRDDFEKSKESQAIQDRFEKTVSMMKDLLG